jgi:hypothetical protein
LELLCRERGRQKLLLNIWLQRSELLLETGLPDDLFLSKNSNLGIFCRALECKMLSYFMTIWKTLRPFAIIYGSLV